MKLGQHIVASLAWSRKPATTVIAFLKWTINAILVGSRYRAGFGFRIYSSVLTQCSSSPSPSCSCLISSYLIFVISFTLVEFLNPNILHPKFAENPRKLQQIAPKSVKYAFFCVQSGIFYKNQHFLGFKLFFGEMLTIWGNFLGEKLSLLGVHYHFKLTSVHYVESINKILAGVRSLFPLLGSARIPRAFFMVTPP